MLDNAIESCMNNQSGKERKIFFHCGNQNNMLLIHVRNTADEKHQDFEKMKKRTWKQDTYAHGIGLSIVQEIMEKYDGIFEAEMKDGMVEVTVGMSIDLIENCY